MSGQFSCVDCILTESCSNSYYRSPEILW